MIGVHSSQHPTDLEARLQRVLNLLYTLVLSAFAVIEPMSAVTFESLNPVRQGALLLVLILLMLLARPWVLLTRELALYGVFTVYMFITLIWAPSLDDGLNTLLPALNFILLSILFGSLVAFHDLRGVIPGALAGFVLGALLYTKIVGFPFVYPDGFSYNAVAVMYLFGLFIALVFGWYTRMRIVALIIALVIMVHIAATTSIKTNLGIALGAGAAALMYSRNFLRLLGRNLFVLGILVTALGFAIVSNDALLERVQSGLDRVSHGVEILQRREDVAGNTSFGERTDWKNEGIDGWLRSPLFGNGVEAFRTDNGITSHSTPIDLLYNTGVIGFGLFYAIFTSLAARLWRIRGSDLGSLPPLIFAGLVCYAFITLSGTMHYNSFMAIFFAVSVGLLRRQTLRAAPAATAEIPP
jgi:hypothetical protein